MKLLLWFLAILPLLLVDAFILALGVLACAYLMIGEWAAGHVGRAIKWLRS